MFLSGIGFVVYRYSRGLGTVPWIGTVPGNGTVPGFGTVPECLLKVWDNPRRHSPSPWQQEKTPCKKKFSLKMKNKKGRYGTGRYRIVLVYGTVG